MNKPRYIWTPHGPARVPQQLRFFDEASLRLKRQLKVTKDKQVAEMLGMTKTTFSERKKRGSFPEKDLRALAQRRPELGIDVDYVLGRKPLAEMQTVN